MDTNKYYVMRKEKECFYPNIALKKSNRAEYNKQMKIYHEAMDAIENIFKMDLFEYLGIEDNPKREKLFSVACSMGHGGGYGDIACYAEDMVELIR